MTAWFYPVFFVSGAAGLIYQVVWVRGLADALGSTVVSMTAVFSVFLGGLAIGAWLFGRSNPWGRTALGRYVWMEVAIALTAVGASVILFSQGAGIAARAPGPEHLSASVAYAFLVSVVLIWPPTLLMGGTLPTLLGALAPLTPPRRAALHLYGWNTVGAATGALAAGFVLIWALGLKGAIYTAAALDLISAAGAFLLLKRVRFPRRPGSGDHASGQVVAPDARAPMQQSGKGRDQHWDWPTLAFVSGGLVLSLEILWGRVARFLLGDRTQAIAALLFVFIAALGTAALLAPRLAEAARITTPERTRRLIGGILVVGATMQVAVLLPVAASLDPEPGPLLGAFRETLGGRLLLTILLMAPPILVLGLVFPLLLWGADRMETVPGQQVGSLYLINTLGAATGAVVATFLLTRWTGTLPGFQVVAMFAGILGIALLTSNAEGRWSLPRIPVAMGLASAILASGIALSLTPSSLAFPRSDETLLLEREDEYGVQILVETDGGTYRVRNNRLSLVYDLGHPQTTHAQQMAAHLTVLLAEETRNVLNVGTGYGITAGTFTLYPDVEYVQTVEILPFLVELQDWLAPHNFGLTAHPRVDLFQGDGRQALLGSDRTWDIISVNVLDPYLPGSSALYTLEFWRQARDRLNTGGVYTQLFWGADVGLLVRGISQVFPEVHYFPAYGGTSFNIVAFRDALGSNGPTPRFERAGTEARREWLRVEGREPEAALPRLLAQSLRTRERLERMTQSARGPLHTDDRPILEYRWSHGAAGVSPFDSPLILY